MTQDNKTKREPTVKDTSYIAEMVYEPKSGKTRFAIKSKEEPVQYAPHIESEHGQILPLSADNDLLKTHALRLPSRAEEFASKESLIEEIQGFVYQYLDVSDRFEKIAPYYILMTWTYDKFNEIPYLRTLGDYGSGKTRFLETIGSICYQPIFAGGSTTVSPIFRMMDKIGGTLILDEADYRFSNKTTDMVKVLNNGYSKGMPLMRTEGRGNYSVRSFRVFGPKIIASKEHYNDKALESRFIVEQMGQTKMREDIPLNLDKSFYTQAQKLRNKLLSWRLENYFSSFDAERVGVGNDLHPRLQQIALPLLQIIDGDEPREALKDFFTEQHEQLIQDRQNSLAGQVLKAVLQMKANGYTKLKVKDIAKTCNEIKSSGDNITSRKAGNVLNEKLRLNTKRNTSGGNYGVDVSQHEERIEILKEKYGFERLDKDGSDKTEAESTEQLNVSNVAEDTSPDSEITKGDMPF